MLKIGKTYFADQLNDKNPAQRLLWLPHAADIVVCCWTIWKQKKIWYVWLLNCIIVLNCVADLMRDIKIPSALLGIKRNSWWIYEDKEPPIIQRRDVLGLQLKV